MTADPTSPSALPPAAVHHPLAPPASAAVPVAPPPVDPPTQPLQAVTGPAGAVTGPVDVAGPGPAATPWTFVDVFAGLGVVLLASLVLSAPFQLTALSGGDARLVLSALPVWIGLLGTTIWASRRHGTGSLVRDLALRIRWVDLAIGLGAGLALRLVIGIWAVLFSSITGQTPTSNLEPVLGGSGLGSGVWLVVNMLTIAVIGPVIEEIFFRGLGLRSALASLWRRSGHRRLATPKQRIRVAVGATSLVFALLHVSEINDLTSAAVLLPGLFLAGWVLARLTIWSGRLGPAIVTHVVFNGVAVAALLALQ